jgi:hypothetical protein
MILIEWSLVDTTTTIMSSKDITSHVPMFIGQDFRFWKESMTDYLGAQRLLGYALGQRQRPVAADAAQPTQAELVAMADWCYEQLLLFFSSSLTCGCLMIFILLIFTRVYLQENTSCQTHVLHVFASR